MSAEFAYLPAGIVSELNFLNLDEVCLHYVTHIRNFVLDEDLGAAYFNRFASDAGLNKNVNGTKCFIHLINKLAKLTPFNSAIQTIFHQLYPSPEAKPKLLLLGRESVDPVLQPKVEHFVKRGKYAQAHAAILLELEKDKSNLLLADMLAELDIQAGIDIDPWHKDIGIHEIFKKDWISRLAFLYAKNGQSEKAVHYWNLVKDSGGRDSEVLCNYLASSYLKIGDREEAYKLFERSLEIDPVQMPISLAKRELEQPFVVSKDVLDGKDVSVCIYSYNKAELLDMTLKSVCESSLEKCEVLVLLNGCSDGSLGVVKKVQKAYPSITIELINIPINMGAPAARNYLVNHVLTTKKSEYIAFLDDDVTLPVNWLEALVTAIEEDSKIGAVGCKVVNPDRSLQYLFRDVSIVKHGVFRLSLGTPFWSKDLNLYDVRRDVDNVMGCCHLMRRECFEKVPNFDICFSPSQLDDVAFHLDLRLSGYKVRYLGQLECVHHRSTGFQGLHKRVYGNSLGNDVKFYYRFLESFKVFKRWQQERNMSLFLK
ncbi:Glycosyltransferase, GT2 family [Maridesulfovibrio ferrireducens]|uniref:Glycosyltransferase, GT2 family n=1 Tax=Maridesulfovibrio ferrireducens TaxID=246191 RepID=A0A1G9FTH8_9BACT|nr:glycosyltransferase [Maridesulfovibrio ferrireducens]SDK91443.1 Glycosyltransferase, GT2 family [Maridesulfovibrio ferrireducens]